MQYYDNNRPDCFILTSASEGCPVAIQEAIAFGMPLIGTDVNGVSEMIDRNGVLLSRNPSPREIAEAIELINSLSDEHYSAMCEQSLRIWNRDYDCEKNAERFDSFREEVM